MSPSIDTLGRSIDQWQGLYILSITVAVLGTIAIVYFAFHREHKLLLRISNYAYVVASLFAVVSTIVIVNKTKALDAEKDREVKIATDAADLKIAQAHTDAAKALSDAANANQKSEETKQANLQLQIALTRHEGHEQEAEAKLAAQNKETSDFAHALAQQQENMQQQAKVSPVLNGDQIASLGDFLRIYAGQSVQIHETFDTVVIRLAVGIRSALSQAGIAAPVPILDAGPAQGVSVVVHSPQDVPPLANALILGLRQAGIEAHPVSLSSVPKGQVAIYLGPN
jgi:hypothetical protein